MQHSRSVDPAGLNDDNQASPANLVRMVQAASRYRLIRALTTRRVMDVRPYQRLGPVRYVNTNRLVRNRHWDTELSKTGYINQAGRCLAMLVQVDGSSMVMVFLDAFGKLTPFGKPTAPLNKGIHETHLAGRKAHS